MTLSATGNAKSASSRWMAIALFASLAFNLIVVGATAGFLWRHRVLQAEGPHQLPPNILSYTSTLPAERQKELASQVEPQRQKVRPLRRQLREAREEATKELVTEPFDKQRFQAAQSRLLVADQKAREAVHELYVEIAANLTPQERSAFVKWRQKRRPMPNLLDEPDKQASGVR